MAIPSNRTPVRVARGAAVKFTETIDGVAGAGAKALQDGEIVWDETNERFQVKVGGSDSTTLKNQTVSMADPDFTGNANFGVDGTGSDVKLFGDASGEYLLWDASHTALTIDGGDYSNGRGSITVSGEGNFCNSDIHLRQLSEHVASIEIDRSVDDQLILGGDNAFYINDSTTTPSHSNLTIDWDGNINCLGGGINLANGKKITLGDGGGDDYDPGDYEIYHDGGLYIKSNGGHIRLKASTGGSSVLIEGDSCSLAKFINAGACELNYNDNKKFETTDTGVTVTGGISLPSGNISAPAETSTHTLGGTLEVGGPNGNDVGKIKIRTRTANWHGYADATSPATGYSTYGSYFHTGGETLSVNIDTGDYFVIRSSANGTNAKQGTDEIMRFSSGLAEVRGVATGGVYDATSDAASAAASWAIDFADGNNQKVTLAAANLLSVLPTNQTVGQSGSIFITQPGTPLSLGWHSDWKWAGGTAPSLTQTGGATDRLDYVILAANTIHAVLTKAVA